MEKLIEIKKTCKLTDMELASFNQMVINQHDYPAGRTIKEMRIPQKKVSSLVKSGYLKEKGFCLMGYSNVRYPLFIIT